MRKALPLLIVTIVAGVLNAQGAMIFERDPDTFPIAGSRVQTNLTRLAVSSQPTQVVLGSDGSTFDLWEDGVMHLKWAPKRVLVYPLEYLGHFGDITVYREGSPSRWIWYFYPDGRLYYFANGSGPHLYDSNARFYERIP